MDDLVIRDLQKADIEPYLAHIVEHAVKNGIEYPEKRVETFRAVLQRIIGNASEGDALVMKNDDGIVALAMLDYFVDFSDGKTRNAEIMGVYVADEYQRRGIAGRMMDELFVRARGSGCERVFLYARTPSAKQLYTKLGFKQIVPDEYNGRVLMYLDMQ